MSFPTPPERAPLPPSVLSLLHACGSFRLASRTIALRPVCGRGLALVVPSPPLPVLRVCLSVTDNGPLLQAVQETSMLCVVASQPTTHRALQIKSRAATLDTPTPGDIRHTLETGHLMALELRELGYGESLITAYRTPPVDALAVLAITVDEVYDQSPGPLAGSALVLS